MISLSLDYTHFEIYLFSFVSCLTIVLPFAYFALYKKFMAMAYSKCLHNMIIYSPSIVFFFPPYSTFDIIWAHIVSVEFWIHLNRYITVCLYCLLSRGVVFTRMPCVLNYNFTRRKKIMERVRGGFDNNWWP